jgi:hypothetical protein
MIVTIHQPCYLPWLGLMQKIHLSEIFVLMDEVQLSDSAFQNRTQLLSNNGKGKFLTLPIEKKGYQSKPMSEILIANPRWAIDHWNFISNNYKSHAYFNEIASEIELLLDQKTQLLVDVLIRSMKISNAFFDINVRFIRQSELDYDRSKRKSELVVELLKAVGASCYVSGIGAKAYQNDADFENAGIELRYQDFKHPVYSQKNATEFIPGMSAIDVLMNLGASESAKLLRAI